MQKWRGVDGMASSGRLVWIMSNCGMPEGSSAHTARLKGPESDLGVGTLIPNGVGSHWGIMKHFVFGVSPASHIPMCPSYL